MEYFNRSEGIEVFLICSIMDLNILEGKGRDLLINALKLVKESKKFDKTCKIFRI